MKFLAIRRWLQICLGLALFTIATCLTLQFADWVAVDNQAFYYAFDRGLVPKYPPHHVMQGWLLACGVTVSSFTTLFVLALALRRVSSTATRQSPRRLHIAFGLISLGVTASIYNPMLGPFVLFPSLFLCFRYWRAIRGR